jgi:hypothetical protein
LGFDIADSPVTKERVEIEQADQQQIVLFDCSRILRLGILRSGVNRQDVSYRE